MSPAALSAYCAWMATLCRSYGWDEQAREWTRLADFWRSR